MSLEVDRDALAIALRHVSSVVEARTTIPVLANLLLTTEAGRLTVTGTNLDMMASASCPAAGELRTTVDTGKLVAAVESHRPGKLLVAPVDGRQAITIKQGRSVRTLPTLPADDFPLRKPVADAVRFAMPGAALLRLLDSCHVAQSTDETRYYLIGVFVHVAEDRLRAAATDGHRLVRAEVSLPDGAARMPAVIVPTKAVTLLRRLIAKVTADVDVTVSTSAIAVRVGDVEINSKVIDGTFPDYSRVIPQPSPTSLTIGRAAFVDALRSVIVMGDDKVRAVKIDLGGADGPEAIVTGQSGASGREPLDGSIAGRPFEFGVNGQYARGVAELFAENATLTMTLADSAAPMRVTSDKDPDLLAVVMPMRV